MMDVRIKSDSIDKLLESFMNIAVDPDEELEIEKSRKQFVDHYSKEKISSLSKDEYFQGRGMKVGCLTYELEWGTRILGGIGGGSVYKFGYEKDFKAIKAVLLDLMSFKDDLNSFYDKNGNLQPRVLSIIERTRNIKGFISGRSLTGKILRMYYPNTFIQIFTTQEHFLKNLIHDYIPECAGLELYLINNYLLLKIKERLLSIIPEANQTALNNYQFHKLLYRVFPISARETTIDEESEVESINALEVQHLQTLIHRNRKILFPQYKYVDEEYQTDHNGHIHAQEAGTMDFLFLNKSNNFVVIELKRDSSDSTMGQILRYIGWVKENLAESKQSVNGIILAETKTVRLDFALKAVGDLIRFKKLNLSVSIE